MPRREPTGWVGWVYFASVMMMLVGGMEAISGLVALFRDNFYVMGPHGVVGFDLTAWGWIHIIVGVVIFLAGVAVLGGSAWGRVVGVFLAVLSGLANLLFLPAYPIWSIIAVTINVMVIYALTMHGAEA